MGFPHPFSQYRPHPWHGIPTFPADKEGVVHAFIEITPFDFVKYEVDKVSGYLRVDRPQRTSSLPPTLYGFIPRTYCNDRVAALTEEALRGDGDPLDICVLSERPITRAEVILNARVVGGLQLIDQGEGDDKIIAVLDADRYYKDVKDISDLPDLVLERLSHYFSTYKQVPGRAEDVKIVQRYGREHAMRVIAASVEDYWEAARAVM